MKLLIIEDELSLRESISQYFTEGGFLCEQAGTFHEGIQKADNFQYDCIILDINLPDGNGLELLDHLRKDKKTDGVIIISARDAVEDSIAGLELGAYDYIIKPLLLSKLNASE